MKKLLLTLFLGLSFLIINAQGIGNELLYRSTSETVYSYPILEDGTTDTINFKELNVGILTILFTESEVMVFYKNTLKHDEYDIVSAIRITNDVDYSKFITRAYDSDRSEVTITFAYDLKIPGRIIMTILYEDDKIIIVPLEKIKRDFSNVKHGSSALLLLESINDTIVAYSPDGEKVIKKTYAGKTYIKISNERVDITYKESTSMDSYIFASTLFYDKGGDDPKWVSLYGYAFDIDRQLCKITFTENQKTGLAMFIIEYTNFTLVTYSRIKSPR